MQKIGKIQCMGTEKIQFFLLSKPFLAIFPVARGVARQPEHFKTNLCENFQP